MPRPKPRTEAEIAFLALGEGAERWLIEAAAAGAQRVRSKMAAAVDLAALPGGGAVEEALGMAAIAGRFDDGDLPSIVEYLQRGRPGIELIAADETHSAQPGTAACKDLGR